VRLILPLYHRLHLSSQPRRRLLLRLRRQARAVRMLMVSDVRVSRLLVQYMGKAIMDIGV
jgi:hypothetical protein